MAAEERTHRRTATRAEHTVTAPPPDTYSRTDNIPAIRNYAP